MKNGRFAILRIISRLCFYKYRQSGTNVYFVSQVICETDWRREKGEGRREKGEGRREKGEGRREKGEGRRETPGVLADCGPGRAGADVECLKMGAGRGAYWIEGGSG